MSEAEEFKLEYQEADDGIWLVDPEGQGTNLGFMPTLAEVLDVARQHGLRQVSAENSVKP